MSSPAVRLGVATLLVLAYAVPLFFPPATPHLGVPTAPDAWLLARIFPGVSALWVALRLLALAVAAVLLSGAPLPIAVSVPLVPTNGGDRTGRRVGRFGALALAALHLGAAPWAERLGPAGQVAYLAMLFVPAVVLAWSEGLTMPWDGRAWRASAPAAAVMLVWVVSRLVTDLASPRVADVIDGWRGFLDSARFVSERRNLLTDLFDPALPGVGGVLLFFHGIPFFQADLVGFSLRAVQRFQILWVAVAAAGVGLLARLLVGPGVAAIAVAVFLFAPYTRFVTFFPGPFLVGPLYVVALALAALLAYRRRSEAGLAALGACSGIALGYPGVVPLVAVVIAWTLWNLRGSWRRCWIGVAAGLLSFAAAVAPAIPKVFTPSRMGSHFRWDGLIAVIDGSLLGQLPLGTTPPAWAGVVQRPLDIIVSALLAPFANPRVAIRLWGDVLFDPLGTVLLAVGLVACVRSMRRSWLARTLLLTFVVALSPAFVSPVDVANIAYAVVLPVAVALVAAAGFAVLQAQLGDARAITHAAAVVIVAVCLGGTVLFDVVNPRLLGASSLGIMFDVVRPEDVERVVVVSYGPRFLRPTQTLNTGPITAFAGPHPIGYLPWDEAKLPAAAFAQEGKDLLFWSHGFDWEFTMRETICRQWPVATFYEIQDRARLGRVYAARIGGRSWKPSGADRRWRTWDCETFGPPPP